MVEFADYVLRTKGTLLGDRHATDRALAELWGVSTSLISNARYGDCSDPLAMKIAAALKIPPGEVLWAARTARERDPETKRHLQRWAEHVGKALAAVPRKIASVLAALAFALSALFLPAPDALAGGAGRLRH